MGFFLFFLIEIYFLFYLQGIQAPRMNIPNIGNNNQQSVHYTTMGQPPTTQTYYNNPVLFTAQPNRPPSNPPVQPEKRVKKPLSIVDPNTGKDLTNEILHTRESKEGASSHTSTPPSGQESGSRGTPDTVNNKQLLNALIWGRGLYVYYFNIFKDLSHCCIQQIRHLYIVQHGYFKANIQ